MSQQGFVFRQRNSWFLRYRDKFEVDGVMVRKQKCVKLADYCDRYRCKRDVQDLVKEKMDGVTAAGKCPQSGRMFTAYVEETYFPHIQSGVKPVKPSTYAGRKTHWNRYIKPRVTNLALRDFTKAKVYQLLESCAKDYKLNTSTVSKIRAILYGIFNLAICTGEFSGENPVDRVIMPVSAKAPEPTVAATREEVQAILAALKGKPPARAAVAILAYTGVRPGEARGLRWEEWNRTEQHIAVKRSVWHREVGSTKTQQSERFVTVTVELREILLDLWKVQGSPISGYILAGRKKDHPVILDNLAKRIVRPELEQATIEWHGWYALRRYHGTEVRKHADSETSAKALGNSKAVFDKHYLKPQGVLPDVRRAVNDAFSGIVQ
jgi:integrase